MKKVYATSPRSYKTAYKVSVLASSLLIALMLHGCERKPETSPEKPTPAVETTTEDETKPVLQAKVESIPLVIPECEGQQCPQIKLQRLSSNYPEIDEAVDRYILTYSKSLVQGFDLEADTDANAAQGNEQKKSDAQKSTTEKTATAASVTASKTEAATPLGNMTEQQLAAQKNGQTAATQAETQELQRHVDQFLRLANEVKSLGSTSQLNLYISPQVLNPQGPVATVVMNASNYIGGAHGSSAQQYLNFELETKSILSLDQIIENGKRKAFNDLAYTAFQQWIQQTQPDMDVKTYQELWKFTLSENFYLSSNGLILQYGEYEIGPYALGLPRLVIPYDKLQGILKAKYLPVITQAAKPQTGTTTASPADQPAATATEKPGTEKISTEKTK